MLKNTGQVVLEYVLLIVVGLAIVMTISNVMVSRNPNDTGILMKFWRNIIVEIGEDLPETIKQEE